MNSRNRYPSRYSSGSRGGYRRRRSNMPPVGIIAAVVLIIIIAVVIVIVAISSNNSAGSTGTAGTATSNPSATVTSPATGTATSSPTAPATGTETSDPTAPPTAPVTSGATEPPFTGDYIEVPDTIDRGFLADAGKKADGSLTNSWFFGKINGRDADGKPILAWDRYKSTIDLLAKYGAMYREDTSKKEIYLTFDCGYENGFTTKILDVLKDKGVRAIFFCSGEYVANKANRDILLRMVNEGHLIGNHTDKHPDMTTVDDARFISELQTVQEKLNEVLGYEYRMTFYRPPEGAVNERDLYLAKEMGYTTVLWSYTYLDYDTNNQKPPAEALELTKSALHNGCVYLLHAVSETNTEILGDLIDYIRAEGYEIKRVDER